MTTDVRTGSTVDSVDAEGWVPRSATLARWVTEWKRWRCSPAATAGVARWRSRHACLAELGTAEQVLAGVGRDRCVPVEVADARLAALVAEARSGDPAAARVVLERVLPGLVRTAARQARLRRLGFDGVLDDLAAAAWLAIVEYPLPRRPVKIAVNILRDAEYRLFGYVPVTTRATVPAAPDTLPTPAAGLSGVPADQPRHAGVELLEVLASAVRAGLPAADGRLLAELLVVGLTPEQIAARDGVTARAVRWRRQAAIGRLMAVTAAAFGQSPVDSAAVVA